MIWPTIKIGNQNHPEETVELLLIAQSIEVEELAGFSQFTVQKYYDELVENGIKTLQRAKGLTIDGILGPQTWPHLVLRVRKGSTGEAVRAVQYENQYRNMASPEEALGLATDGIFGPKTEHWVKGFQGACELKQDGIVGPQTWKALVMGMYAG